MSDKDSNENSKDGLPPEGKKPYVKPEVKVVQLRPEEAVLGACKGNAAGPAQPACTTPAPCASIGS